MNLEDFISASKSFEEVKASVKEETSDYSDGYNRISISIPKGKKTAIFKVRLLPNFGDGFGHPWQRHVFKGTTDNWIYAFCHNTGGKNNQCPICEFNKELWKTEEGKEFVSGKGSESGSKRNNKFSYNCLVESDPINPENNGKILMIEVGLKLQSKIKEIIDGDEESEIVGINIFDFSKIPLFKIHGKIVSEQLNFDSSSFDMNDTIDIQNEDFFNKFKASGVDLAKYIEDKRLEKSPQGVLKRLRDVMGDQNINFSQGGVKTEMANSISPVEEKSNEEYQKMASDDFPDSEI